jgi:adenosine deaminase
MIAKAELHVHLEGTISPDLSMILAQKNRISLPEDLIDPKTRAYRFTGFLDFIKTYDDVVAALIKTPEDYYTITMDYLKSCAQDGAIYVEMTYSPELAEKNTGIPSNEHLIAIQAAIDDAKHKYNIIGRVLITAIRHFGHVEAEKVALAATKMHLPCVVGFNLGGDEINFPPRPFKRSYQIINDAGLKGTIHAGEFACHNSMQEVIKHLPIQRIGHGIAAHKSSETMQMLKDYNIALEICPSSNIKLRLFQDLSVHPITTFLQHGIRISINSDDPPFFNTSIGKEYDLVQQQYNFSDAMMREITSMAIRDSFMEESLKPELLSRVIPQKNLDLQ